MKLFNTLIAISLAAIPTLAVAESNYVRMAADRFQAADKDKDGKLTKAEAKAGMPRIHVNFDRLDTAKRGYLTLAQVKAAVAAASK